MNVEQRRLAAVMFTDIVGYSSLTQKNEQLALELLEEHRRIVRPNVDHYKGHEIRTIGDAFLIEFPSALEATECAIETQRSLHDYNQQSTAERRVHIRIGIHLGDVIYREGDVLGDAVNIASRIEPLAEPDGICVSEQVYDQIRNKIGCLTENIGPRQLKNIEFPMDVHRILWERENATSSLDKTRIAVLPFANMSPDPSDEYFADGMTEELIDRLAQVKSLKIIARTSVMSYKKKEKKASDIAKELEVGTLVEGSVRKAGNRVRVTVQLISAQTEEHLWSSRYDKTLDDIFAVQSEIAEKVAGELKTQLIDSEKQSLEKKPTDNTEAYTYFLQGRELYREGTETSMRQALGFFEKAIKLDPKFARAYVGMADCHSTLGDGGYEPADISLGNVKPLLKRAIDLDPNLPEAHAGLASMFFSEDNVVGSETEARVALELNPSLPDTHAMLSELAGLKGDSEEMVRQIETAYQLDPIRPRFIWLVGVTYLWVGREEEALELWKKTEQLAPAFTYRGMMEHYLIKRDFEKAREFYAKVEKLEPTNTRIIWMGGILAALDGDREKAMLAIKKIEDSKMGPIGFNFIAYVYHALGDLDSYFEYMNKALERHALIPSTTIYSPLFAKARTDPRFLELVEKLRRQCGLIK